MTRFRTVVPFALGACAALACEREGITSIGKNFATSGGAGNAGGSGGYGAGASAGSVGAGGSYPSRDESHGLRFAAMMAPTVSETFVAPATLRLVGVAYDENVYANYDLETGETVPGVGNNASEAQFLIDDRVVLTLAGRNAEFDLFKGFVSDIPAGVHRVAIRGIYGQVGQAPPQVLESEPVFVSVSDPPVYAQVVDLARDMIIDASGYALAGSADSRVRLNGNGHTLSGSGPLSLRFVDVFDLGSRDDTSLPAVDVATVDDVVIEDCIFDTSSTLRASLGGSAKASIRRNLFRSNMRMPLAQQVIGQSYPALHFDGDSTGAKVFAGNNVAAGWAEFERTQNWLIGGDTAADSNVLIGPRVGIHVEDSRDLVVKNNYSRPPNYGGWAATNNFALEGTTSSVVEHNVVYDSEAPVRGCAVGCEFRYNLVMEAKYQWVATSGGGTFHHNLFVGRNDYAIGFAVYSDPPNPSGPATNVYNNTFDSMFNELVTTALAAQESSGPTSITSNLFVNVRTGPTVAIRSSGSSADYNAFYNPEAANYSDARAPAHDVSGDPRLSAAPSAVVPIDEAAMWQRTLSVADILALYRGYYTPAADSVLVDSGDPAGGLGNDIGAVGAGTPNDADRFGLPLAGP